MDETQVFEADDAVEFVESRTHRAVVADVVSGSEHVLSVEANAAPAASRAHHAGQLGEGGITESMNPIGFTAVGVLVGMFSQQAILKLKEVAETLFSKPEKGEDDIAPKDDKGPKRGSP